MADKATGSEALAVVHAFVATGAVTLYPRECLASNRAAICPLLSAAITADAVGRHPAH